MARICGLDGCRSGWVCLLSDSGGGDIEARILKSFDQVCALSPLPDVIAVDIPVGLEMDRPRDCDRECRKLLGPRRASVFPSPARTVLEASSYREACIASEEACGRLISRQTWGIASKIAEVDRCVRANAELRRMVFEAHPEWSFSRMNGDRPLPHAKRGREGAAHRLHLVERHYEPGCVERAAASLPAGGWSQDDLLDAFAVLWTARRIHGGSAQSVPATERLDRFGIRMAIWS